MSNLGTNSLAPLMWKWCGSRVPHTMVSEQGFYIRFHSDGSVQESGVKLRYSPIQTSKYYANITYYVVNYHQHLIGIKDFSMLDKMRVGQNHHA